MPQCRNGNRCCCEVCTTERLSCDDCCRCVPQSFCVTFEADDPYCECDGKGARAFRDDETGLYEASLDCDGQSIDITLFTEVLYGECVWHLISESAAIDEFFEIRGEYGVGCEDPVFEFDADFYGCPGTVTIRRYEGAKIRFEPPCDYFCGQCRCTCQSLCAVEWIDNEPQEPVRWEWDEDRRAWGEDEYSGAALARAENGSCLIVVDGQEVAIELCDQIEVNTVDEYGNGYVITCWECSCDPSGDGDLVQSTCCGKDPMPRTLYATVERVSDAALCGDHTTEVVELTWQGVQPHPSRGVDTLYWTADINFGDCGTTKIAFFCDNIDCVPTPGIICSSGVIYSIDEVGGSGNRLACVEETTCECDPYYGEFVILPFDAGLTCPNVNCAFKVTISE